MQIWSEAIDPLVHNISLAEAGPDKGTISPLSYRSSDDTAADKNEINKEELH